MLTGVPGSWLLHSSLFWIVMQRKLVYNRRFGTTYPSPVKMGPIGSPVTLALNQYTLCNNPEDGRIQFNRSGSLRSRNCLLVNTSYHPKGLQSSVTPLRNPQTYVHTYIHTYVNTHTHFSWVHHLFVTV